MLYTRTGNRNSQRLVVTNRLREEKARQGFLFPRSNKESLFMLNKNLAILFSLGASMASAQAIVRQPVNASGVTQVHTALEHLSIITLPEKIIRVAAGSDAAQIEWHDNSVFIKPVKNGQATDLMVWTEHQISAYELEAPGPVSEMTFVLDESKSPVPEGTANPESGGKGRGRGTATHYRVDYRLHAPRCHTRSLPTGCARQRIS